MSASRRASSPATETSPVSTNTDVRWSGSTRLIELGERDRARAARRASPRPCSTITSCSGGSTSSSASLTSESTNRVSHCASSIAPAKPAESTANVRASTTRAPVIGSMPSRFHARSANERPGTISMSMPAPRSSTTVRSATDGLPGHRVRDLAVLLRGGDDPRRDRGVHRVEIVAGVVEQVERLEHEALAPRARRPRDGARCARSAPGSVASAARAAGNNRSTPAGPSPTTTTRGRLTRPRGRSSVVVVVVEHARLLAAGTRRRRRRRRHLEAQRALLRVDARVRPCRTAD